VNHPRFVVDACQNGWTIRVYKNGEMSGGPVPDAVYVAKTLTEVARILVNQTVTLRVTGSGGA